jgi:hypothetical protein
MIQNLARIPYALWRYLAENGPTCRKCLNLALRENGVDSDQLAGHIRDLRVMGFQLPKHGKVECPAHGRQLEDRLVHLGVLADSSRLRWNYTPKQIKIMIGHCGGRDAFDGDAGSELELDHRVPRIRAAKDETPIDPDDAVAVRAEFQPLTRVHNLQKSRACETCVLTGKRTPFGGHGIGFWFEGTSEYDDENGCNGCGWAYPEQWHQEVAVVLTNRPRP